MEFYKNILLFGIVVFVRFGRFSAAITGGSDEGSSGGPSKSIGPSEVSSRSKLLKSSHRIRTYLDVATETFFDERAENFYDGVSDDRLEQILSTKIDRVKQTYARYMELHLYLVQGLCVGPIDTVFSAERSMSDYVTNAQDLLAKCRRSLANNGFDVPDWMGPYGDLLDRVKFDIVGHHPNRIVIVEPSQEEFQKLRITLQDVFKGFNRLPIPQYSDVLRTKGYRESDFLRRTRHRPWTKLKAHINLYQTYFNENDCKRWFYYYPVIFRNGLTLNDCLTAIHYYRVGNNLLNLHIILDMNSELLPYDDDDDGGNRYDNNDVLHGNGSEANSMEG